MRDVASGEDVNAYYAVCPGVDTGWAVLLIADVLTHMRVLDHIILTKMRPVQRRTWEDPEKVLTPPAM